MSVKEFAASCGISTSLVYALVNAKKIRHERHGLGRGKIVIPPDALEEYRKGRTVGVVVPTVQAPPAPTPPLKHLTLS